MPMTALLTKAQKRERNRRALRRAGQAALLTFFFAFLALGLYATFANALRRDTERAELIAKQQSAFSRCSSLVQSVKDEPTITTETEMRQHVGRLDAAAAACEQALELLR